MRRLSILFLVTAVGCVGACDSSRVTKDDPDVPGMSAEEAAGEYLTRILDLRERRAEDGLTLVSGEPGASAGHELPEAVSEEWEILGPALFGATPELSTEHAQWTSKGRFNPANGQVTYAGHPQQDDEAAFSFAMAANEGIEFFAFEALDPAESVDQWISREIIRQAGPVFVASLLSAERGQLNVSPEDLAERPELSANIAVIGERLRITPPEEERAGAEHFDEALRKLVLREAISLGSALYRAGGWSGLEWGRIEPPKSSNYAVRPDRWLGGDGEGQWEWPERFDNHKEEQEWDAIQTGVVGPALLSLWLEAVVDPRAARTIYSGWLTDSYRVYEHGEEDDSVRGFNWVSAWQSPHEAQEIAAAAESALGHYHGVEHRERRFRVAVQGVNVAVVSYTRDHDPELLNQEVQLLTEARFGIVPEEGAPLSFAPTLYERYVTAAEESMLDEEEWVDPVAGWSVNVEPLAGWTVQKSDEAHVRWFAMHSDGTMIQWTTELLNPLEPEFGTEEYLQKIEEVFSESVSAQEPPYIEVVNQPTDSTVEMEVMGLIDGRPLALKLWQWRRGDVLVSFSVQGPEETFGERLSEVGSVLESLTQIGEEFQGRKASEGDDGIVEFRIEDE